LREAVGLTVEQVVDARPAFSTYLPAKLKADRRVRARIAEVEAEEAQQETGEES
jgi:hypothetical protein